MVQRADLAGPTPTHGATPAHHSYIHPLFGPRPVRATIRQQPAADEARTADTVHLMSRYAAEDARSPLVRRAALEAIEHLSERDTAKEAAAVWRWITRRVRYIADRQLLNGLAGVEEDAEVLVRPVDLLTMPQPAGDCDDHAMLAASMLRALGIPAAYRTIAADETTPDYSHVYTIAETPAGELALDASHGPYAGWEATPTGKTRTWRLRDMPQRSLAGLAADTASIPWWQGAANIGINTASNILTARYAQAPPGTYYTGQTGTYYRPQAGEYIPDIPFTPAGSINPMWLLLGGGILVVLLIAKK